MTSGIKAIALTIVDFIPGLVIVAVIFMITRFLARIGRLFFDAVESGRVSVPGLYAETAQPTRRIVTVILWLFSLVMMYPYLPGSNSDAFKGVSVFVGLLLSIGSAGTVNQAVSGLMLMYSRALRVGDYVQIGETVGTVVALGMFSTRIRTPWSEIVSLPNAVIVGTTTKNYSREEETGGALLTTTVTIGYNAPWRQVHAMLIEAAHRTEGLLKEPAAPRLAEVAFRLLRRVHARRPDRRASHTDRRLGYASPQHPGRLQRVRRPDHVAPLRGGPGREGLGRER